MSCNSGVIVPVISIHSPDYSLNCTPLSPYYQYLLLLLLLFCISLINDNNNSNIIVIIIKLIWGCKNDAWHPNGQSTQVQYIGHLPISLSRIPVNPLSGSPPLSTFT